MTLSKWFRFWAILPILCFPAMARCEPTHPAILSNGGFESWKEAHPGANGRVSGWTLGTPPQVPEAWSLNTSYPGELLAGQTGAHSGSHFAGITASPGRHAHLYQMCTGLKPGGWYRVSAWTRGGPVTLSAYEYGKAKFLGSPNIAQTTAASADWQLLSGFYRPPTGEYERSALAIAVTPGRSAEIDDVEIAPLEIPSVAANAADIVLESESLRLTLSPSGMVREFRAKPAGEDYAPGPIPFGIFSVLRNGVTTPLYQLTRQGDLLKAQFLDPKVKATFRVTARKHHLLFEVVDVQPADVEQLSWSIPVRRLAKVGSAFNATYDDRFGACLFGTTINVFNRPGTHGRDIVSMGGGCTKRHGMAGAKFALVAAPADQFHPAVMEAEKANGLPCPMLGGQWARDSLEVRKSYLFMVDAAESTIDRTIEYAKLGGFGTIIFLKDNWLSTHGHFEINRKNFPDGLPSLKRTVDKIHAAGLGAGVHVFGPSISPNDAYVTPKPDDRLATIACPPLAEPIDAKATTLTLSGPADLPPRKPRSEAFPGYHLRIGDEIVRYKDVEPGPLFRFTGCQRGALGTKAAEHPAGTAVSGLLTMWSYFLVDPDSTLADEMTRKFGEVFNSCDFDMAYFDASDGYSDAYGDRWYYLNKMHLGFYQQLKKDVLYQTSNGTGTDISWHLVPRSASADGHGDLKGYLDERWPGILGMEDNWTRPDVGWYYIFTDVRPDQIEYVCSKVLGIDGSISVETSQSALEKHVYGRRMIDSIGRYEQCRLARYFPEKVRSPLLEPGKDFRLSGKPGAWKLYHAVYEAPRVVELLDGSQNVWTIRNDHSEPCTVAVEITRGSRAIPTSDYEQPKAITLESFDDAQPYSPGAASPTAPKGSEGVQQSFTISPAQPRVGAHSAVWKVRNPGNHGGWTSVERKFAEPQDLSTRKALALWVSGDGRGEQLRIQVRDAKGKVSEWPVNIGFLGWRLCTFLPSGTLDWSKITTLRFSVHSLRSGMSVELGLDDLRALPEIHEAGPLLSPMIQVNSQSLALAKDLANGQGITADALEGLQLWTGDMKPGQPLGGDPGKLVLQPGENRITFTAGAKESYPGDVTVLVSRLWPVTP